MNLRLLNRLYTALILFLTLFLVYAFASQARIQTDLTALLPSEQQPDALLTARIKPQKRSSIHKLFCLQAVPMPKPLFRRPHKLPTHGAKAAYLNKSTAV